MPGCGFCTGPLELQRTITNRGNHVEWFKLFLAVAAGYSELSGENSCFVDGG
jgi:hypothetical protein